MQASLQLKQQIPNAQFTVMEQAGHEINVDAPKDLGVILNDFF